MSGPACKEEMCASDPGPGGGNFVQTEGDAAKEKILRKILGSWAYCSVAKANEKTPEWQAMIEAIGTTPMSGEQIATAQAYINKLAGV